MLNFFTNKNIFQTKTLIIAGGAVLLVGALIYFFGFTSLGRILFGGRAERALNAGKIEIVSQNDINNYFVFLPKDKVKTLLYESPDKFLFPQIDLMIAEGARLVIGEEKRTIGDFSFNFITISGLSLGTKIYSTVGGFIRGAVIDDEHNPYAWVKEMWKGGEGHEWSENRDGQVMIAYIPTVNIDTGKNHPVFSIQMFENMYASIEKGVQYASLLTNSPLVPEIVPGGANMAFAIMDDDGMGFSRLSLNKILTYEGKIVMLEK